MSGGELVLENVGYSGDAERVRILPKMDSRSKITWEKGNHRPSTRIDSEQLDVALGRRNDADDAAVVNSRRQTNWLFRQDDRWQGLQLFIRVV